MGKKITYEIVDMVLGPENIRTFEGPGFVFDNIEEAMETFGKNYANRNEKDGRDDYYRRLNVGIRKVTTEIIHINKH